MCLAAAVSFACSAPADGKGGKDELRELLAQAKKLGRPQDAAKRVQLLKQATELDSTSVEAARELALASAQLLMGPRLPDDPAKAPTTEAVAALERFRYRSIPSRPPARPLPATPADVRPRARMTVHWRQKTRGNCATRS